MMNEQIADIMDDAQANPEKYTETVGDVNAAPITKEELLARVKEQNEKKVPSGVATQEVQVPSQGYFGGPSVVKIRRMTTKEEKIMFTATDASYLADIVKSCIVSHDIDFHTLHENDLLYLLFAIRNFTFGNTYNQIHTCPYCNFKNNLTIDITALPVNFLDKESADRMRKVLLPDSGDSIELNILTEGDIRDLNAEIDRAILSGKVSDTASYTFDRRLDRTIGDINGVPFESPEAKKTYLENLSLRDYNKLSNAADKIRNSFGLVRNTEFICRGCKRTMEVEALIAPEFFRPSDEA